MALPWSSSYGGRCSALFNPWEWRVRNRDRWAVAGEVLLVSKEVGCWVGGWGRVRFSCLCLFQDERWGAMFLSWDKPAERGCHSGCSLLEERGKHSLTTSGFNTGCSGQWSQQGSSLYCPFPWKLHHGPLAVSRCLLCFPPLAFLGAYQYQAWEAHT